MSTEQKFLKKLNAMRKAFDAKVKQLRKQYAEAKKAEAKKAEAKKAEAKKAEAKKAEAKKAEAKKAEAKKAEAKKAEAKKAEAKKLPTKDELFHILNTGTSLPTDMVHVIADMGRPWYRDQKELDKFRSDVQKHMGLSDFKTTEFIKESLGYHSGLGGRTDEFGKSRKKKLGKDEVVFVAAQNLYDSDYSIKFFPSYDAFVQWAKGGHKFYFYDYSGNTGFTPHTLTSLRKFYKNASETGSDHYAGVLKTSELLKILNKAKSHTPAEWKKYFKALDAHTDIPWFTRHTSGLNAKFEKKWAGYL